MNDDIEKVEDLSKEQALRFTMDLFHRIILHYGLWFAEIKHQMGLEKALEILEIASEKSIGIQLKRLSKSFGFEMVNGLPDFLFKMSKGDILKLMDNIAVNWLANDGVWFQSVEFKRGMTDAKRCNDSCWAHFSPFEAWSIKKFLKLAENPGIDGLIKALNFRLYARINKQSFIRNNADSVVFQMNACRVQDARKRKGLDDYPCKSGGLVEYTYFAHAIDKRIKTTCIGCPPDEHPDEWYCAWQFDLK